MTSQHQERGASAPKMSKRTFQVVALLALIPTVYLVYRASPLVIPWFRNLRPSSPTLMAVLAVLIVTLVCVIAWALLLLPLRARSELGTVRDELRQLQKKGGISGGVQEAKQDLRKLAESEESWERSRYFGRMAAAGLFVTALSLFINWLLWTENRSGLDAVVFSLVSSGLTVFYFVQHLRFRFKSQ